MTTTLLRAATVLMLSVGSVQAFTTAPRPTSSATALGAEAAPSSNVRRTTFGAVLSTSLLPPSVALADDAAQLVSIILMMKHALIIVMFFVFL